MAHHLNAYEHSLFFSAVAVKFNHGEGIGRGRVALLVSVSTVDKRRGGVHKRLLDTRQGSVLGNGSEVFHLRHRRHVSVATHVHVSIYDGCVVDEAVNLAARLTTATGTVGVVKRVCKGSVATLPPDLEEVQGSGVGIYLREV